MTKRQVPTTTALRAACESEEVLKFLAKSPREKERDRAQWLRLMLPVMAEGRFILRERGAWTARRSRK